MFLISLNQHNLNELSMAHSIRNNSISSGVEDVCVWVCWYWLAVMVKKSFLNTIIIQSHSEKQSLNTKEHIHKLEPTDTYTHRLHTIYRLQHTAKKANAFLILLDVKAI